MDIRLEDWYFDQNSFTYKLFFSAPKGVLGNKYPEAESADINVDLTMNPSIIDLDDSLKVTTLAISPVKDNTSYDWEDISIEELLDKLKGERNGENNNSEGV